MTENEKPESASASPAVEPGPDEDTASPAAAQPYRVNLDIYNGPLDLLLYLVRRNEVDIYDIPIGTITEQYLSYLEAIRLLEPAVAGDFLVMAATLMEVKSRMLLPTPPPGEEEAEDPRSELVRQLLEYKRYKEAARWLEEQAEARSERFGRPEPAGLAAEAEPGADLEDLDLWGLVQAFGRLMRETLAAVPQTIVDEDVPVAVLCEMVLERLRAEAGGGGLPFTRLFEGAAGRQHLVGMFLAVLELVRLRRIRALQPRPFGEIFLRLREEQAPPENAPESHGDASP